MMTHSQATRPPDRRICRLGTDGGRAFAPTETCSLIRGSLATPFAS
jgi:hypothetical protein